MGTQNSVPIYTSQFCKQPRPDYLNPTWIFQEGYRAKSACPEPTGPGEAQYQGMYAPNDQCVRNTIGIANSGSKFNQAFIKVFCQANVLAWITCDDNLCSTNCVAGSAPANNDQCTSQGKAFSDGALQYYRYYCPNVITTTTTTTTTKTNTPTLAPSSKWSGSYQVTTTCATADCCCLIGTVKVLQSGSTISATGSLTGSCGTTATGTPITFSFNLLSSTASTASFTFLGQPFTATLSGDQLALTNVNFPKCSGSAVRSALAALIGPSIALLVFCFLM